MIVDTASVSQCLFVRGGIENVLALYYFSTAVTAMKKRCSVHLD